MKWDYDIEVTLDTNDADYIHESFGIGTYDDADEQDQKSLAAEVLVYENFYVEDGENDFNLDSYVRDLKKFGLKPSDRCDDWKKYDALVELENFDELLDMDEDDIEYLDDPDEDEQKLDYSETKENWKKIHDWKEEVEEEVGDCLPWMDNCWNNHSFSYEITRKPAGTREESCEYNYDATSYKDILTFESLNDDEDEDEDEE